MPIYRMSEPGQFEPLKPTPFPDLERVLEDWVEKNPYLLTGEHLAIIARQPRTSFGKQPDLLAVDQAGACVVIELKRGETPREVLAQALEYAAWLDSLTHDQLDALAREYAARRNLAAAGVADLYRRTFEPEGDDDPEDAQGPVLEPLIFNRSQRLIIVAERHAPELEHTLRYMRTRLGVDISGVTFTVHRQGQEIVLVTELVVGREQQASTADRSPSAGTSSPLTAEQIASSVQTDFLKELITAIPAWIQALDNPDIQLVPGSRSDHAIWIRNRRASHYFFARRWLTCYLHGSTVAEVGQLRSHLTDPSSIKEGKSRTLFHVTDEADFAVMKAIIEARLNADPH